MVRALRLYEDTRYEGLARISVAHLYNLRGRGSYRKCGAQWNKTRLNPVAIDVCQCRIDTAKKCRLNFPTPVGPFGRLGECLAPPIPGLREPLF